MQGLDPGLPVALEAEDVDQVEQLWREQGHGQVEQPVTEAYRGHQPPDGGGRDIIGPITENINIWLLFLYKIMENRTYMPRSLL